MATRFHCYACDVTMPRDFKRNSRHVESSKHWKALGLDPLPTNRCSGCRTALGRRADIWNRHAQLCKVRNKVNIELVMAPQIPRYVLEQWIADAEVPFVQRRVAEESFLPPKPDPARQPSPSMTESTSSTTSESTSSTASESTLSTTFESYCPPPLPPKTPSTVYSRYSPSSCSSDSSSDTSDEESDTEDSEDSEISQSVDAFKQHYKSSTKRPQEPVTTPGLPSMVPGLLHRAVDGYSPAAVLEMLTDRNFQAAKFGLTRTEHKHLITAYRERHGMVSK